MRRLAGLAAALLFLAGVAWYVSTHPEDFARLSRLPPTVLVAMVACQALGLWLNGLYQLAFLRRFDIRLGQGEAFWIASLTSLLNWVSPARAGAGFRALYLRTRHGFALGEFLGTLVSMYVVIIGVLALLGLASMGWLYLEQGVYDAVALLLFGALALGLAALMLLPPRLPAFEHRWLRRLEGVFRGWDEIRLDRRLLAQLVAITSGYLLTSTLVMWLAFRGLDLEVAFIPLVYFSCASTLGGLTSITPGALGIMEGMMLFAGRTLGLDASAVLMAALLYRLTLLLLGGALAPVAAHQLLGADWKQAFRGPASRR